ncbi:hypothetical protein WAI453_013436 [Rhynchosporium graminicola]
MALSRAFTTRRNAKVEDPAPKRNLATKHSFGSNLRQIKISAPVELLSTTNMLSYNAPDLYPSTTSSSTSRSSTQSGDESDRSTGMASPPSSVESSPTTADSNHLSCYFGKSATTDNDAPLIPRRSPSHTKQLSIERSASRLSSSRQVSAPALQSSVNLFSGAPTATEQQQHPFGKELAQVSELAEEYGISQETIAVVDEEEQELISRGLFKFRAEDYMSEIQGLFLSTFGDARPAMSSSMWI